MKGWGLWLDWGFALLIWIVILFFFSSFKHKLKWRAAWIPTSDRGHQWTSSPSRARSPLVVSFRVRLRCVTLVQTVWGRWNLHVSSAFPEEDNKRTFSWMLRLSPCCLTLCCVSAFTAPSCKSPRVICRCEARTGVSTFSRWVWDERCQQKCPTLCQCFFKQTN